MVIMTAPPPKAYRIEPDVRSANRDKSDLATG
jgi:hypothetical protein